MRRWIVLIVAGIVVAAGVPVVWRATRPADSAGAPVVPVPALTSRAGETPTPSPAAPSLTPVSAVPTRPAASSGTQPGGAAAGGSRRSSSRGAMPARLSIPSLRIDAPVDAEGVDRNGAMALPADVRRVGWYRFSPPPGTRRGSVVFAGHVDNAQQGTGALFSLRSVPVGASITVRAGDGSTHRYRVTGRQTFVKRRLPVDQLFVTGGPPRLLIITCGGPFIRSLSSYRDNLVVAATPVGS